MIKTKRIATPKQLITLYPAFTMGGLRHLIFNEKSNGFSICIRRIGRKIFIDLELFEIWIDSQNPKRL